MRGKTHKDKHGKERLIAGVDVAVTSSRSTVAAETTVIAREDYLDVSKDEKPRCLNPTRDILSWLPYEGKQPKLVQPDPTIAFEFTPDCIDAKRMAR